MELAQRNLKITILVAEQQFVSSESVLLTSKIRQMPSSKVISETEARKVSGPSTNTFSLMFIFDSFHF